MALVAGVAAPAQSRPLDQPYEIRFRSPEALHELMDLGFDISHVHGDHATVHANAAALEVLSHLGYQYRAIDVGEVPADWSEINFAKGLGQYHNHAELTIALQDYANQYPSLCRLVSLGDSVEGRELWALLITDNPDVEEDEPEFKYVSTMHGNEPVGTEMLLYLIDYLLSEYGSNARATSLVDETAIWIVPMMNPDGNMVPQRTNANGKDLNRSFPAYPDDFEDTIYDGESLDDAGREPEVQHLMHWSAENSFVLAANFHTGALVVNYPYDDDGKISGMNAPSPDDDLYIDISLRYASNNPPMYASSTFEDGITNGTAWYVAVGGMQDWNYRYLAGMEVTIELYGPQFIPSESKLPTLWNQNRESMLAYLESVHIGVRGRVLDAATRQPLWARVRVANNTQPVFTDPDIGDYYRLLLPGRYSLSYYAPGFYTKTVSSVDVAGDNATRLDILLAPESADINGDDAVGASDVQFVINAALGIDISPLNGDISGDNIVNAVDVQQEVNSALNF